MAEQCAFYVRCDRCRYGRNLGSNEYGCPICGKPFVLDTDFCPVCHKKWYED
nr:MAG TPA: putative cytoplasmic protein [Caudoviricetes sp.]